MRSILMLGLVLLSICGCASAPRAAGPYTGGQMPTEVQRDIGGSLAKAHAAGPLLSTDAAQAEQLLREALDLDLYNGVAHNNLGVLFLQAGKLYEAAQEFEWARKLLPGHPDPRLNLAIALQRADKVGEALEAARSALEVQPGHLPAMQAVAVLQIQTGLTDDKTAVLLASICERTVDPVWRDWATKSRIRLESRLQ